ncbi:protein of unknown function [Chitinophaga jiangningensis]|uniref:3-keto-alpha-glucoside-1,2-lyase/3-keto-2-hydroxy-glucal hydratase domain-containing protein n=1 Tax=Chitinophaga jiangningensis TaxID=1419482 RepID=A0A1M7BXC3_9BACT|nr:DUF1080 domain-containing protein [Chitinophaga jiangningensis]SHL59516.1 protein of unknown function [Chitinophaga jiangningensis]
MRKNLLLLGMSCLLTAGVASRAAAVAPAATLQVADSKELIGRWDITVDEDGKQLPSWLEVKLSGTRTLVGYFVGTSGSARPVAKVNFDNGKFSFTIPPQWESGNQDFVIEGTVANETITGTITTSEGKKYSYKGVRAPLLVREKAPRWGKPENLFNGKDLTGWKPTGKVNQWIVKDGVLTSPKSGSNLVSEKTFNDFKLHVEFRYQKGSNSGVYLRGRYETQIEDSPKGAHPSSVLFSGIYGFLAPSEIYALGPDQWQSYDITLVGRMLTLVVNGKTVISNQEIPGITGGALDSDEGAPGPIYFQGDHGPIEFRKVVITPAL